MQIAIDGPAGSGKSTVAKLIAAKKNMIYLDTGAMYRAVTYGAMDAGISVDDQTGIVQMIKTCHIDFKDNSVFLNGKDITASIRTPEVTAKVSAIASIASVRDRMVALQRKIAANHSVVMDGRDIGSVVLPEADYKIYLDADPRERAKRRMIEYEEKGIEACFDMVLADIIKRDESDKNRQVGPLVCVPDAVVIDTTGKTIDDVVESILKLVRVSK